MDANKYLSNKNIYSIYVVNVIRKLNPAMAKYIIYIL